MRKSPGKSTLLKRQQLLRQAVFDHFMEHNAWPRAQQLDLTLSAQLGDIEALAQTFPSDEIVCGSVEGASDDCSLRFAGIARAEGGEAVIDALLATIRFAADLYVQKGGGEVDLRSNEVAQALEVTPQVALRSLKLMTDGYRLTRGSGADPQGTAWVRLHHFVSRLKRVDSLSALEREATAYQVARSARSLGRAAPERETVGSWDLVRRISAQGPNEVWQVVRRGERRGERFALKRLRSQKSPTSSAYRRFVEEIQTTSRLSAKEPGIVRVEDFGIPSSGDDWAPYYVMPLAEATLEGAAEYKGDVGAVLRLGQSLATSLGAAHDLGVIHRDIKPSNILLFGDDRRPVISDFGICFLTTSEEGRITVSEANTLGSIDFVAPELLGGGRIEDVDVRADIYSLGKTLYSALAGGNVFPRERFTDDKYDLRLSAKHPGVHHFYGLLSRMSVEDRGLRFTDMQACSTQLERAAAMVEDRVPFFAGAFGGPLAASVRARAIDDNLNRLTGVAADDSISDALTETRQLSSQIVSDTTSNDPKADIAAASNVAEQFLAVGLPIIRRANIRAFREWVAALNAFIEQSAREPDQYVPSLEQAAGVIAYCAARYLAWYRKRWPFLRELSRIVQTRPDFHTYLGLAEEHSSKSWDLISKQVMGSAVLGEIDRVAQSAFSEQAQLMNGTELIRYTINREWHKIAESPRSDVDWPALYDLRWMYELPASFLRSVDHEIEVSRELFNLEPDVFREVCGQLGPKIVAASMALPAGTNRRLQATRALAAGAPWRRWTGK